MGTMIDAENPANIPASWDGQPSVRITVLASEHGQVFDRENGNASAVADARAIRARIDAGKWAIAYVNEDLCNELGQALAANGVGWSPPELWPEPGCYLWATDPSANIAAGRWVPPVRPLAVQYQFSGTYDLSDTAPNFTAKVAGYLDGPASAWPPAAWARFTAIPDTPPAPARPTLEDAVESLVAGSTIHLFDKDNSGNRWHWWVDTSITGGQPGSGWQGPEKLPPAPAG